MSKLSLIRDRKYDAPVEQDLRGMGEESLFKNSAPFAVLLVKGFESQSDLGEISHAYHLARKDTEVSDVLCLVTRDRTDGGHKVQALSLFFAALEMAHRFPGVKLGLFEVRPLYLELKNNICHKGKVVEDAFKNCIGEWNLDDLTITIDSHIHLSLAEAGILVGESGMDVHSIKELSSKLVSENAQLKKSEVRAS